MGKRSNYSPQFKFSWLRSMCSNIFLSIPIIIMQYVICMNANANIHHWVWRGQYSNKRLICIAFSRLRKCIPFNLNLKEIKFTSKFLRDKVCLGVSEYMRVCLFLLLLLFSLRCSWSCEISLDWIWKWNEERKARKAGDKTKCNNCLLL